MANHFAIRGSTGPWCDSKADPGCTKVFLYQNGGLPQEAIRNDTLMQAHLDSLKTGADLTLPVDWDGVIGFVSVN